MKFKQENGITIVALGVTIVVMIIIAGISINIGNNVIEKAERESIKTNMLLIQAKTKIIAEEANFVKSPSSEAQNEEQQEESKYLGNKLSDIVEDGETLNQNLDKLKLEADELDKYYVLEQKDLNDMGLNKIQISNGIYYLVNYDTEEIIYIPGYKYDGKVYYKLSEISGL